MTAGARNRRAATAPWTARTEVGRARIPAWCTGILAALSMGLAGCGALPGDERSAAKPAIASPVAAAPLPAPAAAVARAHVVQRGDTLNGLSRRYGAGVAELAGLNGLAPPYVIKVGQTLRLPDAASPAGTDNLAALPRAGGGTLVRRPAQLAAGESAPTAAPRQAVSQAALPLPALPQAAVDQPKDRAAPVAGPAYVVPSLTAPPPAEAASASAAKLSPAKPTAAKTSPAPAAQPAAQPAAGPLPAPPSRSGAGLLMPVPGRVIAGYGPQAGGLHNDGINIAAAKGTPVKAADNGIVAYAGNELRGFGNMLLIQHAGGWMTAYAHLDSMAVERGQRVTRGQKIGAVGMSGNVTRPQLHFEVRQGKQPVDPDKHLAAPPSRTAMIGQLR